MLADCCGVVVVLETQELKGDVAPNAAVGFEQKMFPPPLLLVVPKMLLPVLEPVIPKPPFAP